MSTEPVSLRSLEIALAVAGLAIGLAGNLLHAEGLELVGLIMTAVTVGMLIRAS